MKSKDNGKHWDDATLIAEFETHLAYWKGKMRMRDLDVRVGIVDRLLGPSGTFWCVIERDNNAANHSRAALWVNREAAETQTRYDIWETVAHELVHTTVWPLAHSIDALKDHFSTVQHNLLNALNSVANEAIAYKYEAVFAAMCIADAPPKEFYSWSRSRSGSRVGSRTSRRERRTGVSTRPTRRG